MLLCYQQHEHWLPCTVQSVHTVLTCQTLEMVLEMKWWLQLKLMGRDGAFLSLTWSPSDSEKTVADSEVPFCSLNLTLPPTDMAQPGTSESLRTVREYCEPRS